MDGIRYWIETEGTGHWFFIAFPVVLLCLLIWFKGQRVRFLIPSILISLVIINPWFYQNWDELGLYAYWRILWVVPVIPILATIIPSITEMIKKSWMKAATVTVGIGLIIFGGTFLYNGAGGSFVEAANASKLPENVVAIADRLLELDEHPRVIAQDPLGVYLRQYSGKIDTLYGRDLSGYITTASDTAQTVHSELSSGEMKPIAQYMLDDGFDYLVYNGDAGERFELVDMIAGYGIYKAQGTATEIKKRDDLDRIVSITTVDEYGTPQNNENGYATIEYEYDNNGYISFEQYKNEKGYPVITNKGYASVRISRDKEGRVIQERYYNEEGGPMQQSAGHYAIRQEYDHSGRLLSRIYIDKNGEPVNRKDGYSRAVWELADNSTTTEIKFYSTDGSENEVEGLNLADNIETYPDGWSEWITPYFNQKNSTIYLGQFNLGEKAIGDCYTCQIEIEYRGVKGTENEEFRFWTQGSADGKWDIGNIWNGNLIWLDEPPNDGRYYYSCTCEVTEQMVSASTFDIGFRCDYWSSGSFRVRGIMIEKGGTASGWIPGL